MEHHIRMLSFSDREGQAIFRALLQYETTLHLSGISDCGLVEEELQIIRELQERISLASYYPKEMSDEAA